MIDKFQPYLGLYAYEEKDHALFFGRDPEAQDLFYLITAHPLVLLYAKSGLGKSSLLNAKIIPLLNNAGFNILKRGRRRGALPAGINTTEIKNLYIFETLVEWSKGEVADNELTHLTLEEYFTRRIVNEPLVLIFDQFEEIFSAYEERWEEREVFFTQISHALAAHPLLRVVFVMREDYLGQLDLYAPLLPDNLGFRYRLEGLRRDAALQAITGPLKDSEYSYSEGVPEKLVRELIRTNVVDITTGNTIPVEGEFVEPVQLSVVCYSLFRDLPDDVRVITDVNPVGSVDRALEQFYDDALNKVCEDREVHIAKSMLRQWCEEQLITSRGTRGSVPQGKDLTEGLPNHALDLLEEQRLLHREWKYGVYWYELSHDRLVRPILNSNSNWLSQASTLQKQAFIWDREKRPERLLLRGKELEEANTWASENPDEVIEREHEFLAACQKQKNDEENRLSLMIKDAELQAAQRNARRLWIAIIFAGFCLLVAIYFAIRFSASSANNANLAATNAYNAAMASTQAAKNELFGKQQSTLVAEISTLATENAAFALEQSKLALENAQVAATSQANEATAIREGKFATSRQLAAQAVGYMNSQPDLANLLAVEAYNTVNSWEAKSILLRLIQRASTQTIQSVGRPIPEQGNDITDVVISPDGARMAWGDMNGKLIIWNYQTQEIEYRFTGGNVSGLAFHPYRDLLAIAHSQTYLELWDYKNNQSTRLRGVVNFISDIAFSPRGDRLAAVVGTQVRIWELAKPENPVSFEEQNGFLRDIAWSPDGRKIVSGGSDRCVTIWDAENGEVLDRHTLHTNTVMAVAWSPDGKTIASGGTDQRLVLYDYTQAQPLAPAMKLHGNHSVYSLAFSSDGRLLASGGGDGVIVLVDMETLKPLTKPEQSFTRGITSVNFSPRKDQLLLAAGSFDDTVGIFNVLVQQPLSSDLVTLEGNIVGISPGEENETWIAFSDEEGSEIHHLNISTDELVTKMDFPLKHAVFNPDHTLLAVKTVDDLIFTIELPSGRLVHEFKDFVANSQLAFSQDGNLLVISGCKYIFIGGDSGRQCEGLRISFLDPVSGEPLQPSFDLGDVLIPLTGDYILSMAISPDKSTLAIGNQSKSIFLIDVANGEQVNQPLQGHTSGVVALAFSPDGITLASADEDNMIMLWDMEYNLPIADPVRSPIGSIRTMAFSRDGLTLYLGSEDGRVIAWNANGKSWMEMNCSQAGRILTIEEWRQFLPDKKYQPFCTGAE